MKNVLFVFGTIITSALILLFLYKTEKLPNIENNGFVRNKINGDINLLGLIKLPKNGRSFCVMSDSSYFFSTNSPGSIIKVSKQSFLSEDIKIGIEPKLSDSIGIRFKISVDIPNVFIYAYNIPMVIVYNIEQNHIYYYRKKDASFSKSISISPVLFITRQLDFKNKDQIFAKWNAQKDSVVALANITPIHSDGGIITDGHLLYDKINNAVVYVSAYLNGIYILDTNLNLATRFKTIDTIQTPKVKIRVSKSESYTNESPILLINKTASIYRNCLIINSALRADNEKLSDFNQHSEFDVYSLDERNYIGSFIINNADMGKVKSTLAIKDQFFVCYEKGIQIYNIIFSSKAM